MRVALQASPSMLTGTHRYVDDRFGRISVYDGVVKQPQGSRQQARVRHHRAPHGGIGRPRRHHLCRLFLRHPGIVFVKQVIAVYAVGTPLDA